MSGRQNPEAGATPWSLVLRGREPGCKEGNAPSSFSRPLCTHFSYTPTLLPAPGNGKWEWDESHRSCPRGGRNRAREGSFGLTKEGQPEERWEAPDEALLCPGLSGGKKTKQGWSGLGQEGMSVEGGVLISQERGLNGKRNRMQNSLHHWPSRNVLDFDTVSWSFEERPMINGPKTEERVVCLNNLLAYIIGLPEGQ